MRLFRIKKDLLIILIFSLTDSAIAIAQDNTVKLPIHLGIEGRSSLNLAREDTTSSFSMSSNAKQQMLSPGSTRKIWINYSSIMEWSSTSTIYVSLGSGNLPAEISLKLEIGKDVGAGSGQVGVPTAPIYLTYFPQPIITDIGSCFTGKGVGKGHLLTYTWELDPRYDPDLFNIEDLLLEVGIIYTIKNNE